MLEEESGKDEREREREREREIGIRESGSVSESMTAAMDKTMVNES